MRDETRDTGSVTIGDNIMTKERKLKQVKRTTEKARKVDEFRR